MTRLTGSLSEDEFVVRVNANGGNAFPVIAIGQGLSLIVRAATAGAQTPDNRAKACLAIARKFVDAAVKLSPDDARASALVSTMRLLDSALGADRSDT